MSAVQSAASYFRKQLLIAGRGRRVAYPSPTISGITPESYFPPALPSAAIAGPVRAIRAATHFDLKGKADTVATMALVFPTMQNSDVLRSRVEREAYRPVGRSNDLCRIAPAHNGNRFTSAPEKFRVKRLGRAFAAAVTAVLLGVGHRLVESGLRRRGG